MRERAEGASPGPWHQMCMGSEGCQVLDDGHLRDRKHVAFSGRKEWKADHADAEYIASMHPLVALAVADWLDAEAEHYDDLAASPYGAAGAEFVAGGACGDPDPAIVVARAYLGSESE
jgi:hypothetical protein